MDRIEHFMAHENFDEAEKCKASTASTWRPHQFNRPVRIDNDRMSLSQAVEMASSMACVGEILSA
ncbi:hypothetical protein [Sphingomonas sp.]|uniref:hypothetical protein n=1 Tax=Sphingomonas sp. TaxID=28214 RepID=UPI0031D965A2